MLPEWIQQRIRLVEFDFSITAHISSILSLLFFLNLLFDIS